MSEVRAYRETVKTFLGLASLVASFFLLPMGVAVVRAEDAVAPAVDSPVEAAAPPGVVPLETEGQIESAPRPLDPRTESAPGVIVLNTRGYNYGPERPTAQPQAAPPAAVESSTNEDE